MEPRQRIRQVWSQLDRLSYYELLGVGADADRGALQRAFHDFAEAFHPDRHLGEDPQLLEQARMIFQRGVEAYGVLRNERAAEVYRHALSEGRARLTPGELERLARPGAACAQAAPTSDFAAEMKTAEGRAIAARVQRLMAQGRYPEAYQQLGLLELAEGDNEAVRKHLAQLSRGAKDTK